MRLLRNRLVLLLLVLVLVGSASSVHLALTRTAPEGAGAPPGTTGDSAPGFRPATLAAPRGPALEAAVAAVSAGFSYDHRDLDGSLEQATATMTERAATALSGQYDAAFRREVARDQRVAVGLVRGAGVVRVREDGAVVCLLYVDQRLVEGRAPSGAAPRVLGRYRADAVLVERDGTWLVDDLAVTSAGTDAG